VLFELLTASRPFVATTPLALAMMHTTIILLIFVP
jgi:hypothetical protein